MALGLAASVGASAMSSTPPSDPIQDFQNSWAGKALSHQRAMDVNSPLIDNNILGSSNPYQKSIYRIFVNVHCILPYFLFI